MNECVQVQAIPKLKRLVYSEWQVFRDTENTEKSRKLSTKRKIGENGVFGTQNKIYIR